MALNISWRTSSGLVDEINCEFKGNYETTYTLNMFYNIDTNGQISWVDMGAEFDTIISSIDVILESTPLDDNQTFKAFENHLINQGGALQQNETNTLVISGAEHFFPLTPMYKSNMITGDDPVDFWYELSIGNHPQPKNYNIFTKVLTYDLDVFPNEGVLVLADAFATCDTFDSWTIDGLGLPYPDKQPSGKLNINHRASQLNTGASNHARYGVEYGEISKITVRVDEEHARLLLLKLQSLRGSTFTVVSPENYYIFAHLYDSPTGFECILSDNKIKVDIKNFRDITITFSVQLVGVL